MMAGATLCSMAVTTLGLALSYGPNLPAGATNVTLTGGDEALITGPDGNTQVTSTFVELDKGESMRLRLEFTLPVGVRALSILPSAREPRIFWHIGNKSWHDTKTQIIAW